MEVRKAMKKSRRCLPGYGGCKREKDRCSSSFAAKAIQQPVQFPHSPRLVPVTVHEDDIAGLRGLPFSHPGSGADGKEKPFPQGFDPKAVRYETRETEVGGGNEAVL
jgi:hypothetical protein